ncbi:hypothetical protein FA15DRAFT_668661 [Coprinopsis marcescibilis]|uniref:WSC domain-containing protein n=1 Tax=Coprinopsis marcescibilis TaxID=230819 RepID=A0A5C3KXA3_COPMA|nr:hypothetical protein FA15DRAFT_668661 [Coprinopsis marcescibilis]
MTSSMMLKSIVWALTCIAVASAQNEGPPIRWQIGPWRGRGCYVRDFGVRMLDFHFAIPEGISAERCTSKCAENGYGLAGLENGNECWCDNYNHLGELPITTNFDCDIPCAGNQSEWCGSANRMLLYENTEGVPPSPSDCINWRTPGTFAQNRLQAIPKSGVPWLNGAGTVNLRSISTNSPSDPTSFRVITACETHDCFWRMTDDVLFPIVDGRLTANTYQAIVPTVGDAQVFRTRSPASPLGHNGYCVKPNPVSQWPIGFVGFPVVSVDGRTDLWALCTNTTAGGRTDLVYSPRPNHPHYVHTQCQEVYLQILPYITSFRP